MYVDIDSMNSDRVFAQVFSQILNSRKNVKIKESSKPLSQEEIKELIHKEIPELELENVKDGLDRIARASEIYNKRVKLRINQDINRVIITIIDKETNKVIKEIPCEEIQNLAKHLKEAIGILFDRTA